MKDTPVRCSCSEKTWSFAGPSEAMTEVISIARFFRCDDRFQRGDQIRQFGADDLQKNIEINRVVAMNEPVAQADDLRLEVGRGECKERMTADEYYHGQNHCVTASRRH